MYSKALQTKNKTNQQTLQKEDIVNQMLQSINLSCFICSLTYNNTNRVPKIICRRQHTYCSQCVNLILRARPCKCPECRFKIFQENILINRSLLAICQFLPLLNSQIYSLKQQNSQLKKENTKLMNELHIIQQQDKDNNYITHKKQSILVKKLNQNERSNTTEPKNKNYQIRFKKDKKVMNEKGDVNNPEYMAKHRKYKDKASMNISIKQVKKEIQPFVFNPIIKGLRPQK